MEALKGAYNMNEALRARLAEIDAQPAENLTRGAAASLAAAEAMDDGTAENINDYIARKTKTTKAQQAAVRKYVKKTYDRMDLVLPKGQKAVIKTCAASLGETANAFVNRAISDALAKYQANA